jgi:hypothetical protein
MNIKSLLDTIMVIFESFVTADGLYQLLKFIEDNKNIRYFKCSCYVKGSDDIVIKIGQLIQQNRAAEIVLSLGNILTRKN